MIWTRALVTLVITASIPWLGCSRALPAIPSSSNGDLGNSGDLGASSLYEVSTDLTPTLGVLTTYSPRREYRLSPKRQPRDEALDVLEAPTLVARAKAKPNSPDVDLPNPSTTSTETSNNPFAGLDPTRPDTSSPNPSENPFAGLDPTKSDTQSNSPSNSPTTEPDTTKPNPTTNPSQSPSLDDESSQGEVCERSLNRYRARGSCISRQTVEDDGFSSEPSVEDLPLPPPQPDVGPPVDRRTVENWYNVVETTPTPLFRAQSDLDRRINSDELDRLVPTFGSLYRDDLQREAADIFTETENREALGSMLQLLGRDSKTPGETRDVMALSNNDEGKLVYSSAFSKDGRIIVADTSFKEEDTTSLTEQQPWNRLIFAQYKNLMDQANNGNLQNLNLIGRHAIINEATVATIDTALTRTNQQSSQATLATFSAGAPPGTEDAKAFEALCRTDNVNGVLFLLSDYHNALGNKRITNIHVQVDKDREYNMWIEIGE